MNCSFFPFEKMKGTKKTCQNRHTCLSIVVKLLFRILPIALMQCFAVFVILYRQSIKDLLQELFHKNQNDKKILTRFSSDG